MEACRSDEGFRDAVTRGVPGAVGVGVGDVEVDCGGGVDIGRGWVLKVDVDAVAWWVEWRYGERDGAARDWEDARGSSLVERLLIVSTSSSSALSTVFKSDVAEMPHEFCFDPTRLAIAQGNEW